MEKEIKSEDVELVIETWSASMSDCGAIWKQWQTKLDEAKSEWSVDYAKAVFAIANERWK